MPGEFRLKFGLAFPVNLYVEGREVSEDSSEIHWRLKTVNILAGQSKINAKTSQPVLFIPRYENLIIIGIHDMLRQRDGLRVMIFENRIRFPRPTLPPADDPDRCHHSHW